MSAHTIPGRGSLGDPFMSRFTHFEPDGDGTGGDAPVAPAPADPAPAAPAPAADPDGGGTPAVPAAASGAADAPAPADPPAATPAIDWSSPEAQAAMESFLDQRDQQALAAQQQAEADAAAQTEFSDIEEAFELLGITPERFQAYLGQANAPLAAAAQQIEQQEVVKWVDGQLKALAPTHPDLLGDGIAKLAELVNDEGQPLFNPDEVSLSNRNAVLFAASALQQAGVQDHGQALTQAAGEVAKRDDVIGRIAVERFKQSIRAGGLAPDLPNGGGSGGIQTATGLEGGDELAVARRIMRERSAS